MKTKIINHRIKWYVFVCLIFLSLAGFGQGNSKKLIQDINFESLDLSASEQTRIDKLKQNPNTINVYAIEIGSLVDIVESDNGSIPIKLPGMNGALVASTVSFEFYSDDHYNWSADFKNDGGNIMLVCKKGKFAGRIATDHKIYEVRSLSKDKHLLVELDLSITDDSDPILPDIEKKFISETNLKGLKTQTTYLFKVLILYTDSCNQYYDNDMSITIDLAVFQLNQAFDRSLSNYSIEAVVADSMMTTYNESALGEYSDLTWVTDASSVATARSSTYADLVVLLTYREEPGTRGIAWQAPEADHAFAVVNAPYITGSYSFVHELGHLFGCEHQRAPQHDYYINHGYIFQDAYSELHRTLMYPCPEDSIEQRELNFSNPDKYIGEDATGTQYHNNALWIEQNAATIEDFEEDPVPNTLVASISGPTHGMLHEEYTWYADYSGGIGPYTCTWYFYYLTDYVYAGTGWSYSHYLNSGSMLYLKVIVTSADNQTDVEFYAVTIDQPEPMFGRTPYDIAMKGGDGSNQSTLSLDQGSLGTISIYPNPTMDETKVTYSLLQSTNVEIRLSDLTGKNLWSYNAGIQESGSYTQKINTSNLSPGIYFCSVKIGESKTIKKVVIQ